MAKVFHLLKLAESFYKKALWSYFVSEALIKRAADDLISEAEQFDIKNENLFNQFESFMAAYKELLDSFRISPDNLTQDGMQDAAQLVDTLNTRYERIMNNTYLNVSAEEGYDEDFDPGDFSAFIQKVVRDAEDKLKDIAGEDIDIGEMRAAQYAQEFNVIQEKAEEGKQEQWSARKIEQALEARRNWFKNLMFAKKLGPSNPLYARYEKYIAMRREHYQDIIADPQRKAEYREKSRSRQKAWRGQKEKIRPILQKKYEKIRERKESADLNGLTTKYKQQLASLKKDTADTIKNALKKDPVMRLYNQAIDVAERQLAASPSPTNQSILDDNKRKAAEFITNHLTNHPRTVQLNEDLPVLYVFRDACRDLEAALKTEGLPNVDPVIMSGSNLIRTYGGRYKALMEIVRKIVELLSKMRMP